MKNLDLILEYYISLDILYHCFNNDIRLFNVKNVVKCKYLRLNYNNYVIYYYLLYLF